MNYNKLTKNQLIDQLLETRHANEELTLALKEKEYAEKMDSYYEFFKSATDMVFGLDQQGLIKWVNQQGVKKLGYEKDNLEGSFFKSILQQSQKKQFDTALKEILNNEINGVEHEFSLTKNDESIVVVKSLFQKLITDSGAIHEIVCYCQDITKKVQDENTLRNEEENFQTLTNNLNVGVYRNTIGQNGVFFEVNPAFLRIFGYRSKSELLKKNVTDLYLKPEERNEFTIEITNKGYIRNREVHLVRKNGTIFTAAVSAVAIKDNKENIRFVDGIIEDITVRKKAEEALSHQLQISSAMNKLNEVVIKENVPSVILSKMVKIVGETIKLDRARIYFVDKEKKTAESLCQWENPLAKEITYSQTVFSLDLFEKSIDDIIGKNKIIESHTEAIHPTLKKEGSADIIHNKMNIKSLLWLAFNINENGFHMLALNQVVNTRKWNKQEIDFLKAVTKQVTIAIIKIELVNELLHSEESYKGLFDSTTDAIYIQDKKGKFVTVNKGAENMYGYSREHFIGKTPEFLSAPGKNDLKSTIEKIELAFEGKPQSFIFIGIDKKGREFPKEVRISKGVYFGQEVVVAFARDITDRIAAQESLIEKEKKFRRIFNAFPDIYFKSSTDGTVKEISPSVKKITGYKPEEIIGQHSSIFYYSEKDWNRVSKLFDIDNATEVNDFDTRIKAKDGRALDCSFTARIVFDENKNPIEIEGALRDITDRKKAEKAIFESQRRMSTLMGNLQGMAYRCKVDKSWTMEFVSNGSIDLTGYWPSEIVNNSFISFNDIIIEEDREEVWKKVQFALKEKLPFKLIYRIKTKEGQIKWVSEQGIAITSGKSIIALEGFITNITEQKLAEEEIRKLSRSVEQTPNIIIITDLNAKIEYVNPRFTEITGYSLNEVVGRNPRMFRSGNTPEEVYKDLWGSIRNGKEWHGEWQNRKKNGDLYWESSNIFPLKDEAGNITHFIGMKEDITNRKKMDQELIKAKEKAEESDKLKSAFLANMSHEIRTPMNAILGFSQLLNENDTSESEQGHYISLIQNNGKDLMNIIDDIIDISKIEAGQLKISKSVFNLDEMLAELYDSFSESVKMKPEKSKLKFVLNKPNNKHKLFLYSDIDRLKQVIKNLLSNALKFTDKGIVEFGFEVRKAENAKNLVLYVKDTGVGISPVKQKMIFESFSQANDSDSRIYGGTGLGLAISKKIVEMLDGEIILESKIKAGSTFFVLLPADSIVKN